MTFARISVEQAKALIQDRQANVVDVRDRASFESGHISGAQHLDNETIGDYIAKTDHGAPVIVCCYHGNMSQGAADYLNQQGFQEAYSLDGGYAQWKLEGDIEG